jgi:hypothetical protein
MKISNRKSRLVALFTGAAVLSTTLIHTAPAKAADSKSWKYGAVGLGVLGALALSKGKNIEGAAALGGAYYAYKKGEGDRKEELRDERRNSRRYDYRNGGRNNGYYNNGYGR